MKKSQIEFKLDQELCHEANDQAIEIVLVERLGDDDKEKDIELGDNNDLDLSDAQLYIHVFELSHICWRKVDAIDNLKFSILFHL